MRRLLQQSRRRRQERFQLPAWANDREPVGRLYRGSQFIERRLILAASSVILFAVMLIDSLSRLRQGAASAETWVVLIVVGMTAVLVAGLGLYTCRWQRASIEINHNQVLVRNPRGTELFELAALIVSEPERRPTMHGLMRVTSPDGRSVLCYGVGRGSLLVGRRAARDFKRAVQQGERNLFVRPTASG